MRGRWASPGGGGRNTVREEYWASELWAARSCLHGQVKKNFQRTGEKVSVSEVRWLQNGDLRGLNCLS